jgi:hypothetical protein
MNSTILTDRVCVYCLGDSSGTKGRAHVFPEGLLPNGPIVPLGAVCDGCNQYIGSNLESVLLNHPLIALPLQLDGLPGKRDRPRKKLSIFERNVVPNASITFPIEAPKFSFDANGVRGTEVSFNLRMAPETVSEMDCFRRALHHIGFNLLVRSRGSAHALTHTYDPVRQYVRRPTKGERWPFLQIVNDLTFYDRRIRGGLVPFEEALFVRLRMLTMEVWIDLLNTGRLLKTRVTVEGNGKATMVGSNWEPSPAQQSGNKRYRASID